MDALIGKLSEKPSRNKDARYKDDVTPLSRKEEFMKVLYNSFN